MFICTVQWIRDGIKYVHMYSAVDKGWNKICSYVQCSG